MKRKKINFIVLGAYILFYLVLFAQFPLKNSIPGNCDTWAAIALSNTYLNEIVEILSGEDIGNSMYPVKNVFSYGEASPGCGLLFLIFRLLGFNDIYSYYFYISFIFALTAFGGFLLAKFYTKSIFPSFFAGFAFSCTNFMFANIDDSIVVFYFLPALSILYLKKYFRYSKPSHLFLSSFFGGAQAYFSGYVFLFQTIIIITLIFLYWKEFLKPKKIRFCLSYFVIYFFLASPLVIFYFSSYYGLVFENPHGGLTTTNELCSLGFANYFQVLPDNLIYQFNNTRFDGLDHWVVIRKSAFIGFLVVFLAGISFMKISKSKIELVIIALLGLILCNARTINLSGLEILSPLGVLYLVVPILTYIRIPLRAHIIFILAISILSAFGMKHLIPKTKMKGMKRIGLIFVFCLVHFLENVPVPLISYNIEKFAEIPVEYKQIFADSENKIILELPSRVGKIVGQTQDDLFQYNREFIYMNWQTQHKQNILNGANGYIPEERLQMQKFIDQLPASNALAALRAIGLDCIVFHKDMVLNDDIHTLDMLLEIKELEQVLDTERLAIFHLRDI